MKATTIRRNALPAFAAAFLSLAIASCNSIPEEGVPGPGRRGTSAEGTETLELTIAGAAPSTKVSIRSGSGKFSWSIGDEIAVWCGTSGFVTGEVKANVKIEDTFTTTISSAGKRGLLAFYPDDVCTDETNMRSDYSEYAKITYKGIYSMVGKSEEYVPMPMAAINDQFKSGLHFYHAGGLLRFKMYAVPAGTTWIKVESHGNSELSDNILSGDVLVKKTPLDGTRTDPFFPSPQLAAADNGTLWDECKLTHKKVAWVRISETGLSEETDGVVINLPVPQGSYSTITLDAYSGDGAPNEELIPVNLTRETTDYDSGGDQIKQVLNWDCERAQGHEMAVCFGYREPSDPIVGATSAQHKFSVGPNKYVYIARSNLAYFGESFPDSPWRLTQNPWDGPVGANGKSSDFSRFYPKSSGYVPAGKSSGVLGEYQPWVHSSAAPSVNLEDIEVELQYTDNYYYSNTYRIGNLKPEYDWGLYNGRGSNSLNLNATGLYTYEGKELQGQWRTMRLEEVFYLLGIPALDNDIKYVFDAGEPELDYILQGGISGGYCIILGGTGFGAYSTPTIVDFPAFYYDYSANQWASYKFLIDSYLDDNVPAYSGWVKTTNISEANYQVLNSGRYDSEGNPQYAEVTIVDQATLETISGLAILRDGWEDPCKNESSADGKIAKGRSGNNLYTKERWKFFMEPSGAVFIWGLSLKEALLQVSWLAPLSFQTENNTFYRYDVYNLLSYYGLETSVNGKTIPYFYTFYNGDAASPVYLVQDAN